jgi:DNA-binding MarR family transcriptional regulator
MNEERRSRLTCDQLLHEISTLSVNLLGRVNLSEIARRYGVSPQYVHKLAQKLKKEGLVDDQYRLTDKGREALNSILIAKEKDLNIALAELEYIMDIIREVREEVKRRFPDRSEYADIVSRYLINGYFGEGLAIFLVIALKAYAKSLNVSEKQLDRELNRLWNSVLKRLIKLMVKILKNFDARDWLNLTNFFYNTEWYAAYHIISLFAWLQLEYAIKSLDSNRIRILASFPQYKLICELMGSQSRKGMDKSNADDNSPMS